MNTFLAASAVTCGVIFTLGLLLSILGQLGRAGRAISDVLSRTPGLDAVVFGFTAVPWIAAAALGGWSALAGAIIGQLAALYLWTIVQELTHRRAVTGPRIVDFINRTVGRVRNHTALLVTAVALPAFLLIRLLQVVAYPFLIWLLRFPRYTHAEWINVSRQKFNGLVGHDLLWCLYCDWMTGVYALGGEMLRNVESLWCPIRFINPKKCENCRIDFPDIDGGWVDGNGTMHDVNAVLEQYYADGRREWFGHRARLTVNGSEPAPPRGAGSDGAVQ